MNLPSTGYLVPGTGTRTRYRYPVPDTGYQYLVPGTGTGTPGTATVLVQKALSRGQYKYQDPEPISENGLALQALVHNHKKLVFPMGPGQLGPTVLTRNDPKPPENNPKLPEAMPNRLKAIPNRLSTIPNCLTTTCLLSE